MFLILNLLSQNSTGKNSSELIFSPLWNLKTAFVVHSIKRGNMENATMWDV